MKNIVSFETATRMKEAGFPQPEPEVGQVWVEMYGSAFYITEVTKINFSGRYIGSGSFNNASLFRAESDTFCPTATDILLHMRDGTIITIMDRKFICYSPDFDFPIDSEATPIHENPAEAAAMAWLRIAAARRAYMAQNEADNP